MAFAESRNVTLDFDVELCIKASCPDCKRETSTRVVYGYPLREDFPAQCIYGGDACPAGSPTHYCDHCHVSWCLAECTSLFFAFPNKCYFCSDSLDANDKLTYSMEFEEWIANEESGLSLTDDTFTQSLYPVCGKCRDSIRTNLHDLAAHDGQEDRQRVVAIRLAVGTFVFFVLLIAYAALTKN